MLSKIDLKNKILSKRTWWINDLKNIIESEMGIDSWNEFRIGMDRYGDYPLQSMCTSSVLSMLVDDIDESRENILTQDEFEILIRSNEFLRDQNVINFIRVWKDDEEFILRRFGAEVLEKKDQILTQIEKVNRYLKNKIDNFYGFRFFDSENDQVFFNSDYNYGTDNPSFIGLSYINLSDI